MSALLPAYVKLALEENQAALPSIVASPTRLRDVLDACDRFRLAAIGALFLTGRFGPFGHRLHQSGRAFAAALARLPETARATGRARPFVDALAADDREAALEIARLCRRTWMQGEEFEEDFLFHEILMQIDFLGASTAIAVEMLTRYEEALAGTEDPRLPVLRALVESDGPAFDRALKDYLRERARELDQRAATRDIPAGLLATEWHLSVEGVALVRVARRRGLKTAAAYRQVPKSALEPPREDWSRSRWQDIDTHP